MNTSSGDEKQAAATAINPSHRRRPESHCGTHLRIERPAYERRDCRLGTCSGTPARELERYTQERRGPGLDACNHASHGARGFDGADPLSISPVLCKLALVGRWSGPPCLLSSGLDTCPWTGRSWGNLSDQSGASPPMVAAGAAVFTDDHLGPLAVIGILIVSAGILGMGWCGKRKLPAKALATALITAAFTASYTIVDGIGARLSGNAVSFALWLFMAGGIATLMSTLANIRLSSRSRPRIDFPLAIVCGLLQMFSYGAVIWASSLGPLGVVSALRETSVVFAVLIGYVFLGEKPFPQPFLFCIAIACGCACFAAQ